MFDLGWSRATSKKHTILGVLFCCCPYDLGRTHGSENLWFSLPRGSHLWETASPRTGHFCCMCLVREGRSPLKWPHPTLLRSSSLYNNSVSFIDWVLLENKWKFIYLCKEFAVSDVCKLIQVVTFIDNFVCAAVTLVDVSVYAVVGDVEVRIGEPFIKGTCGLCEDVPASRRDVPRYVGALFIPKGFSC